MCKTDLSKNIKLHKNVHYKTMNYDEKKETKLIFNEFLHRLIDKLRAVYRSNIISITYDCNEITLQSVIYK